MWAIVLLISAFFAWSMHKLRYFSSRGVRTFPPYPLFGNLTAVTFGRENFVDTIAAGYEAFSDQRYFGIYQYYVPTLIPRDPELLRQILVRDFNSFTDRGVHIGAECDPLFGKNLIMLQGSKWREMRNALTPAFSGARMRCMTPLMDECARAAAAHLKATIKSTTEIDTEELISACVNDVIASCAFGFSVNTHEQPQNAIYRLGQTAVVQHTTQITKFFGYENFPSLMKLLGIKLIPSNAAEQFSILFKSAMKARRENLTMRPDFIQTLVDAAQGKLKSEGADKNEDHNESNNNWSKKFTDDDLVAQAVLFYIAGLDTTCNLINFFLYEMAMNPEVQKRLQEELDTMLDSDNTKDLYEKIQSMEYLDMSVSEVLRLWPLVGAFDRRSVTTYDFGPTSEGSACHLVAEAGIHIWIPAFSLHRDPRYWDQPERCIPERFAPDRRADIVPYTYLPFGTGPRACIGSRFGVLTAKIVVARLLREFTVSRSPKTPAPQRLAPRAFILRPAQGFFLNICPRHAKTE